MLILPDHVAFPNLTNDPTDANSVVSLLNRVEALNIKHNERVTRISATVDQHFQQRLEQYGAILPKGESMPDSERQTVNGVLERKAEKDAKEVRAAQLELNRAALDADEKDAHDTSQRLNVFMSAISDSPAGLLSHLTLNNPEWRRQRGEYLNALASSGHAELKNAAISASASGNLAMASAVATLLDRMPTEQRPLNSATLAAKLVGTLYNSVRLATDSANSNLQSMINRRREVTAGRPNHLARMTNALNRKAIADRAGTL
jgi:hypothetical protein